MRIAQFSDCYTPRINGVTTSIRVLKQALEAEGHEVFLFAPKYRLINPIEANLHRWSSLYMPLQPEDRASLLWPPAEVAAWWRSKVDIVHIHTPFNVGLYGWLKARLQGVPMVFTHHTLWEAYAHYLKIVPLPMGRWIGRKMCDFYFHQAQAVVMPSLEVQQQLRESGRVRGRSEVISTGIYCEQFADGDPRVVHEELGLTGDEPMFLYVGRIGKEKSLDFVVDCFAQYRRRGGNGLLVIIGGGPEVDPLQSLTKSLGVEADVRFLGYRQREVLKHYMAAARAFLFASQTETQGLVILEAAASGLPVIAARASGVNEAVEHMGSGVLVEPGDREAFVQAMQRLESDLDFWASLSQRSRVWAERFSAREMGRKMLELYASLAS